MPLRSFHENFGYSEPICVRYIAEFDKEHAGAIKAENEERERRINEFETADVELAYNLANLIRCSSVCILPAFWTYKLFDLKYTNPSLPRSLVPMFSAASLRV